MVGMLLTGTLNTITLKLQNERTTPSNDGKEIKYKHPFLQTVFMFAGECLCLIMYFYIHMKEKKNADPVSGKTMSELVAESKGLKTDINPLVIAIPAAFDVCSSTLSFIALTMVDASFYQMMRGSIVVITALLSIVFLKRRLYRHHWTSMFILISGIVIVGFAASYNPNKNHPDAGDDDSNYSLGIVLLLVSKVCSGGMFIAEEKIFEKY